MPPVFPNTNLGIKVEILLNGTWTDITAFTYVRNGINITDMGRADWTSALRPAQVTMTLNNRDGRFTPKLAAGAYFPNITRNTQLRVSVNAQSITGVSYSGFRFWGEISEWPPHWDPSGKEVSVDIVANGIWRRMSQLQTTLGSAFTRYNAITLTGTSQPRAYWPMEDGTGSGQLVSFDSVAGTANAVQSFITGAAGLSLAANTDFKGSDGIPVLNAAKIIATVPAGGTATVNCTRFLISVPANGDSASGTTNWNLAEIDSSGTIAKFEVYLNATGTLLIQLRNSGGAVVASGTTTTNVKGKPVLASCELTTSGANVAFAFRIITAGAAGITESLTGTVTTASVGAVTSVIFGRANVLMDTAVGQLSVTYGAVPLMVPAANALNGYTGEFAMDRFTRICGEMGIAAETIGTSATTAAMGPQFDDTLENVLQIIEDTDCGLLFESRGQFGMGYRSSASMANQAVAATFSYTAATLDQSLAPVYDDQLTRNNVTVTNWTGYTQEAILTAGAMSVLNPPNGVGNGYSYQRTVSAAADSQVAGIATFLLNVGSVDEVRFPVVMLRMIRASNAALFAAVPGLRVGDYFQITNPPAFLTATAIKQLVWGYSETLNAKDWTFSLNSVPESPWETGFSPGTTQIAQLPGSGAATSTAPGSGGLGGVIVNGSITPAMLNEGITIHTLGGNAVTISASAPATPNLNDIWIASATGLISQWNGTIWAPFKFDGTATIQAATITAAVIAAGTIVASNIAAGTITAALLAAGIVVANIVNATTIQANNYLCFSGGGEFLAYNVANGWQFGVSGGTTAFFTVATSQASLIQVGDVFTWTGGGGPYTVTSISLPAFGFVNVSFTPTAGSAMSTGTVSSGSGSGGTGALINSIAGSSGTDLYGNTYPQGLLSQQLTLLNQSSAPPGFAGASVLYSDPNGRLRFNNSAGAVSIVDRSVVNVAQFTVGNTNAPGNIAAAMTYFPNESNQSSEFEIEISGLATMAAASLQNLFFELYIDGAATTPPQTVVHASPSGFVANLVYAYTLRFIIDFLSTGSGATAIALGTGIINLAGQGGPTNTVGLNTGPGSGSPIAIDSTASHTFQVKGYWANASSGQTLTTYRTKLSRRD
jgi:hypothetical protein